MARATTGERSFIERARREQIVNAAVDVLCDNGFAAASLGAIAEHIGVSKGVLTYHFASKSELLREVITHVLTQAGEYMVPRVEAATSYLDAFRIYLTSNMEFIDAHRREIVAFTEIVNGLPQGGVEPPPYGEGHREAVGNLQRLLEAGQAAGEFGEFSGFAAATSVRASVDALSFLLRVDPAMDVVAYGAQLLVLYGRAIRNEGAVQA